MCSFLEIIYFIYSKRNKVLFKALLCKKTPIWKCTITKCIAVENTKPSITSKKLFWKIYLCMVVSCACFGPRHYHYSCYSCRSSEIAAVSATSNVFTTTWFWPRMEFITTPTPSGCTTFYATVTHLDTHGHFVIQVLTKYIISANFSSII